MNDSTLLQQTVIILLNQAGTSGQERGTLTSKILRSRSELIFVASEVQMGRPYPKRPDEC